MASTLFEYVAETLAFWEDYLVKVTAEFAESHGLVEGEYVVLNDCFQELCGVPDGYGSYPWNVENINNQLTVAYLRYHLSALLEMAAAGYGSAAQAARWREILEHLPRVPTATGSVTQNVSRQETAGI